MPEPWKLPLTDRRRPWRLRDVWDESKHPRDPGGPGGGQFIEKGTTAADEPAEPDEATLKKAYTVNKVALGWYANAAGTWGVIGDDPGSVPTKTEVEESESHAGILTGTAYQREWVVVYDPAGTLREYHGAGSNVDVVDTLKQGRASVEREVRRRAREGRAY